MKRQISSLLFGWKNLFNSLLFCIRRFELQDEVHQDDLKEKDEFILFFKIVLGKIASAAGNKNKFFIPNSSDVLCLFFVLYPSSMGELFTWQAYPRNCRHLQDCFTKASSQQVRVQWGNILYIILLYYFPNNLYKFNPKGKSLIYAFYWRNLAMCNIHFLLYSTL